MELEYNRITRKILDNTIIIDLNQSTSTHNKITEYLIVTKHVQCNNSPETTNTDTSSRKSLLVRRRFVVRMLHITL